MPTYRWSGAALPSGTVLDGTNTNAEGNGDGMVFQALSGGATRTTIQESNGNGVAIVGPAGSLARLDTATFAGGAELSAIQGVYQCPATVPTGGGHYFFHGRNANATAAFIGNTQYTASGFIEFRNASDAVVTSSISGSATTARTPALVAGNYYKVDAAYILNTLTTPTTSNGRIIGRVNSITAPGTWNGGAEWWFDSGYTVNVTVDKGNMFRTGKVITTADVAAFRLLNLAWKFSSTVDTSTVKANSVSNFVQASGPTIVTTGTGAHYIIYQVGTATQGGALTYTITQTSGTTQAPVSIAPGIWRVDQDTAGPLNYQITVAETGAGSTVNTVVVPAITPVSSGQFRRQVRIGGTWQF